MARRERKQGGEKSKEGRNNFTLEKKKRLCDARIRPCGNRKALAREGRVDERYRIPVVSVKTRDCPQQKEDRPPRLNDLQLIKEIFDMSIKPMTPFKEQC